MSECTCRYTCIHALRYIVRGVHVVYHRMIGGSSSSFVHEVGGTLHTGQSKTSSVTSDGQTVSEDEGSLLTSTTADR